jgi:hypothetical protein
MSALNMFRPVVRRFRVVQVYVWGVICGIMSVENFLGNFNEKMSFNICISEFLNLPIGPANVVR